MSDSMFRSPLEAVVTGSSRRVGGAIAQRLAAQGHDICISFLTSAAAAQVQVERIRATGGRAIPVEGNVGDPTQTLDPVGHTASKFGGIRIVVGNAGFSQHGTLGESKSDHRNRAFPVHAITHGYTRTGITAATRSDKGGQVHAMIPADRFTEPEEIVALGRLLASEEAANITGEWISGGLYMR